MSVLGSNAPRCDEIVVAILAKDKAPTLPLYLDCLLNQTFPKERMHLYIRANDSSDSTVELLREWVNRNGYLYKSVTADYSDVGGLRDYRNHEWDAHRFSVLAKIRQASVDHARNLGCHYFVSDVDNFIIPNTLQKLFDTGLPVVAPLLRTVFTGYSNFHSLTDAAGYAVVGAPEYYLLLRGVVRGLFLVNVVHCTYLLRNEVLEWVTYEDNSARHEYVILSERLRCNEVPQYLDNRQIYGLIGFLTGDPETSNGEFEYEEFAQRMNNLECTRAKVVNDDTTF